MIDPPKRLGQRLTYDAECLYNDWQEIGGCSCHTGCAPCSSCCSEGNPISLEENDEAWELDYTIADVYNAWKLKQEVDMSRSSITGKGSGVQPPKSEWFGFKYRVTPESSKLLQEAVFKDGGSWWDESQDLTDIKYDNFWLFVKPDGELSWGFTGDGTLPEKQPPQPVKVEPTKKDFIVGKYYKCVEEHASYGLHLNKYYELLDTLPVQGGLRFKGECDRCYWGKSRFDINSESDYDPNTAQPDGYTAYVVFKQEVSGAYYGKEYAYKCSRDDYTQWVEYRAEDVKVFLNGTEIQCSKPNDFSITKEDVNMSTQNRVVSVKFFDDDAGLKAEHSLVAEYQVTTRVSDSMTVSKVLLTEDVAGAIELHNGIRTNTVDLHVLKNTGNKVMLQPVEFEDLRVVVTNI